MGCRTSELSNLSTMPFCTHVCKYAIDDLTITISEALQSDVCVYSLGSGSFRPCLDWPLFATLGTKSKVVEKSK